MKEFSVVIEFSLYCPFVVPYIPKDLPSLYGQVLGQGEEDVATILFRDEVDFIDLISYLQKNRQTLDGLYMCGATSFIFLGFPICGWFANKGTTMLLSVVEAVCYD